MNREVGSKIDIEALLDESIVTLSHCHTVTLSHILFTLSPPSSSPSPSPNAHAYSTVPICESPESEAFRESKRKTETGSIEDQTGAKKQKQ